MSQRRLHNSTSPYLQQHADNPVDWWPWCPEALALAKSENKPILLSIGYSACHWCHVMAHESFEDPETAEVMNALYVNIKVDREERPDLDKIYQTAHQLLARRAGGWPLTVFLTPDDQTPFFAGTYFPPQPRHGLPSFRDLLGQVEKAFREQREAIDEQNGALIDALSRLDATPPAQGSPDKTPITEAVAQLAGQFDNEHGGFGDAPKFPHPTTLRFLLRHGLRGNDAESRRMALHTLEKMASGGINDHLGGGFCRYSVDALWMIPHFEKMLYDNGQLLGLFTEAWASCGQRPLFKHVCERTAEWLMREMQSPTGGYFASLDADSEGEEGLFYVWDRDQVAELLDTDEYRVFAARFGLDRPSNFEGRWHLHTYSDTDKITAKTGLDAKAVRHLLSSARHKLFETRETRVRPGRDEKILTSWNALMIKGMATAGRVFERDDWLSSAEQALRYLLEYHIEDDRLLASSRDGHAHLNAYLDDYAYLIDAIVELLQARWSSDYLEAAQRLATRLIEQFEDSATGGFFFTSNDHETLVHRPKPIGDDAVPSGNGMAIEALQALSTLTGDPTFQAAAERALNAAWPALERTPYAHVGLLEGLHGLLDPPELLIMRGNPADASAWQEMRRRRYVAGRRAFLIPLDAPGLPETLAAKRGEPGAIVAYRCRGTLCESPVRTPDELRVQ